MEMCWEQKGSNLAVPCEEFYDTLDGAEVTGDDRDGILYRVELESGETIDVRWHDLRPPTN